MPRYPHFITYLSLLGVIIVILAILEINFNSNQISVNAQSPKIIATKQYLPLPLKISWKDTEAKNYYVYIGPKKGSSLYYKKVFDENTFNITINENEFLKTIPKNSDVYIRLGTNRKTVEKPSWTYVDYVYTFSKEITINNL